MTSNSKISVVTVCYNAVSTIEKTILSVINQTYQNIEYIIIDGSSTDGTVDVINKYKDKIDFFVSEPDKGIYDAMNKAIIAATGEWINFMNAGDCFHNNYVLEYFKKYENRNIDIIYGSVVKVLPDIHYRFDPYPLEMMEMCMPLPHQGTFIRTSFHKRHLFDTSYKSSGDYHFFYHAYFKYEAKFYQIDLIVADFDESEGMSKNNIKTARLEDLRIWGKEHSCCSILYAWIRIIYSRISKFVKSILPDLVCIKIRNYRLKKRGYHLASNNIRQDIV